MKRSIGILTILLAVATATAAAPERAIESERVLAAGLEEVWNAWTTPAGVRSFFAPDCNVEPRVDGPYEIFFNPEAEPGKRGADGMRILALEPMKRFAFTWNAPLTMPEVRRQRTHVTLHFEGLEDGRTRLRLRHAGWGEGEQWDQAFEFFTAAWDEVVLPRLERVLAEGPVDWNER